MGCHADLLSVVVPDPAVAAFRAELLARWSELEDQVSPTDAELQTFFVIVQLPYDWDDDRADEVVALALRLGPCHYDPQTGELLVPEGHDPAALDRNGAPAVFPWADPDGPIDGGASHSGSLPGWPIWDVRTSPRLRARRLTVDAEQVTLYRGEDIVTRRGAAVVTGEPGSPDPRRLTAALRDELAAANRSIQ